MLEIAALWYLCTKMGAKLRAKGWVKTWPMQVMVVLTWLGGMFAGSFGYGVYVMLTEGEAAFEELGLAAYAVALVVGVVSVAILFLIASALPDRTAAPSSAPTAGPIMPKRQLAPYTLKK